MFNKSFSLASLLFILLSSGVLKNIAAVLGQFCAEVIVLLPLPLLKQFHREALIIGIFLEIFAGIALKLPIFSSSSIHVHPFHPFQQTTGNSFNT